MRLIDADKLKISYDGHFVGVAKCDLDNAPTVEAEPIKYGHWIVKHDKVKCSACGYEVNIARIAADTFCGNCGAKMVTDNNHCEQDTQPTDKEERKLTEPEIAEITEYLRLSETDANERFNEVKELNRFNPYGKK